MATITIGAGATNRPNYWGAGGYTVIQYNYTASGTGKITSISLWPLVTLSGVKCGTFTFVSGTDFTYRDHESIGTVSSGLQTFTGLDCDVETGDNLGFYTPSAGLKRDNISTGDGTFILSGDNFSGTNTFTSNIDYGRSSMEGVGSTPVSGIKWNGTTISKLNNVAVSKLNGI